MENSTLDTNIGETLNFTDNMKSYLVSSAKWAKFLSILGFIYIAFIVIGAFSAGSILGAMGSMGGRNMAGALPGAFITGSYLVFAAIYFFPVFFMFKFASSALKSVENNDQHQMESSFHNLKRMYQYVGIFTVISLAIALIAFVVLVVGGASMM